MSASHDRGVHDYLARLDAVTQVDRREFLKLMSASLALAGVGGACTRQPHEEIVPYVKQPAELVLGNPLFYATAAPVGGYGIGVLAESHEGRPTKLEGNPEHPASLGAADALVQAQVLELYDPDRSRTVTSAGEIRPWGAFRDALRAALAGQAATGGAGLRILTETVTSPTVAARIAAVRAKFPQARWHQWEPVSRDGVRMGARRAFGRDVATQYRLARADVVVALDADLFGAGPGRLRLAREFARRRRPDAAGGMLRLYVAESTPTVTGSIADHRLPVRAGDVEAVGLALAAALGVRGAAAPSLAGAQEAWVAAVATDLAAHRGRAVVVPGERQPAAVHALAHAINAALGAEGRTVVHTEPVEAEPVDQAASLGELVAAMEAGSVELLLVLGGNPVYAAPPDARFAERLEKVGLRVHLGLYDDETAERCHWHLPEAHWLESWGDVRGEDGTVSVLQPLIAPLYGGKTAAEVLALCTEDTEASAWDLVRARWREGRGEAEFEAAWRQALHDGVVAGTALPPVAVELAPLEWRAPAAGAGLEVVLVPDASVHDGRFANNGWLQELPRPMTHVVWGNAALVAPATAARLGVATDDVVEIVRGDARVRVPVWVVPGQAADSIALALGYGRRRAGRVGTGVGVDATPLRTVAAPHVLAGVEVRPTGERVHLVSTQEHHQMEGRPVVRHAAIDTYRKHPHFAREMEEQPPPDMTLFPPHAYPGHAWGMAIDLSACIGCNACTLACQAENNIPIVGPDQVDRGREMHWIRVDHYWEGDAAAPDIYHQPVPCMHCENAPCEVVCPVNATVHSSEGLNEMTYNRCVGTRYCSNNCPYKVRRFNFYLSTHWEAETEKLVRNPDVSVRSRGVMEKCTYCVQRIEEARAAAIREGRPLRDGDIVTACQQACPTEAIVFGDQNDPTSRVAKLKAEERSYGMLASLNTRPRTTYLARIGNPAAALAGDKEHA